jgi:DNA-binding NarL/FixJ family response regulator
MTISVLIADDHQLLREGFRAVTEQETDIAIVAEAGDGITAVDRAHALKPDVAILDISMPGINGIEAAARIRRESTGTEVIILSMHTEREYVIKALKVGAKGYLVKSCASAELVDAIRAVARKGTYLSPAISSVLIDEIVVSSDTPKTTVLSPRENQVVRLIAAGQNTKEIAFELEIGTKTVETYRRSLMKKLQLSNVAELTRYAIRMGMIDIH